MESRKCTDEPICKVGIERHRLRDGTCGNRGEEEGQMNWEIRIGHIYTAVYKINS